jgi:hypothetical protein
MITHRQALAVLLGSVLISAGAWAAKEGPPMEPRMQVVADQPRAGTNRISFARLDTDGDGRITFPEARLRGTTFHSMDSDHNGYLTRQEYRRLMN